MLVRERAGRSRHKLPTDTGLRHLTRGGPGELLSQPLGSDWPLFCSCFLHAVFFSTTLREAAAGDGPQMARLQGHND